MLYLYTALMCLFGALFGCLFDLWVIAVVVTILLVKAVKTKRSPSDNEVEYFEKWFRLGAYIFIVATITSAVASRYFGIHFGSGAAQGFIIR